MAAASAVKLVDATLCRVIIKKRKGVFYGVHLYSLDFSV